jgi:DNA polymerase III subunit alpha
VLVRATVDRRGENDEANLIVNDIIPIAQADAEFTSGIRIQIDEEQHNEGMIAQLKEILRGYPGKRAVDLAVKLTSGDVVFIKTEKHRVDISPEMRTRLDDLLGPNSHRLITARPTLKAAEPFRRNPARAK